MSMSEEDILAYAGFDAAIFLRFYSLAFKVIHVSMYLCTCLSSYQYMGEGKPVVAGRGGGKGGGRGRNAGRRRGGGALTSYVWF